MKNQKGFALVLALVLLVVMSLMGGALIVVSSSDHQTNNVSDNYEQTFYVAETALLEGEKFLINEHLGPWQTDGKRGKRNINPKNVKDFADGKMDLKYTKSELNDFWLDTEKKCLNSFTNFKKKDLKVVTARSYNFGKLLNDSLSAYKRDDKEGDTKQLKNLNKYFYEYFVIRGGSATLGGGSGSSVSQSSTDATNKGISYKIYGCGIYNGDEEIIIALESSVVLPRQ